MCTKLLLLGKGGKTVYIGPTNEAVKYFASQGFDCPPLNNPADFFMEVISGYVLKEAPSKSSKNIRYSFGPQNLSKPRIVVTDPQVLPQLWEEFSKSRVPEKRVYNDNVIIDFSPPNFIVQV